MSLLQFELCAPEDVVQPLILQELKKRLRVLVKSINIPQRRPQLHFHHDLGKQFHRSKG